MCTSICKFLPFECTNYVVPANLRKLAEDFEANNVDVFNLQWLSNKHRDTYVPSIFAMSNKDFFASGNMLCQHHNEALLLRNRIRLQECASNQVVQVNTVDNDLFFCGADTSLWQQPDCPYRDTRQSMHNKTLHQFDVFPSNRQPYDNGKCMDSG